MSGRSTMGRGLTPPQALYYLCIFNEEGDSTRTQFRHELVR